MVKRWSNEVKDGLGEDGTEKRRVGSQGVAGVIFMRDKEGVPRCGWRGGNR